MYVVICRSVCTLIGVPFVALPLPEKVLSLKRLLLVDKILQILCIGKYTPIRCFIRLHRVRGRAIQVYVHIKGTTRPPQCIRVKSLQANLTWGVNKVRGTVP